MSLDPDNTQKLDDIEAQLRQAGEVADQSLDDGSTPPAVETPTPEPKAEEPKPGEEPAPKPKEEEPPKGEKKPGEEQPPDSSYTKAKKDGERLDRSWKKLDEEKADLERRERELAERQKQPPSEPTPAPKKGEPLRDQHGNSAADYKEAAKVMRQRGEDELADKAEAAAKELEGREQQQTQEGVHREFLGKWHAEADKVIKAEPELAKQDSPLAVKVKELLESGPFFHVFENGFPMAVESARLQLKAARVDELLGEIERLTKENKELREATSIAGSDPAPPPGAPKKITDLPPAEAEAQLRSKAAELDAAPTQ